MPKQVNEGSRVLKSSSINTAYCEPDEIPGFSEVYLRKTCRPMAIESVK